MPLNFKLNNQDIPISQENFEILQPIFLVAKFLGILPVRFVKHGSYYRLEKSMMYGIYSYALTIVLTVTTLLGIINDLKQDEDHSVRMGDKKSRFVTSCDISIVIIIVFFGTLTLPQRLKNLWKLLRCLNQIDFIIPLTKQKEFRKSSLFFMATIFVMTMAIFTFDVVIWTNSTTKKLKVATSLFKNYSTFYVLYLIVVTQETLFWHLIFFIKIRISVLNKYLRSLDVEYKTVKKSFVQYLGDTDIFGQEVAIGTIKSCRDGCKNKKKIDDMSLVEKITALTKFEEKIFETVQSVNTNGAFGVHLIVLSCLLHLIVTPYFLLTEVMKTDGNLMFVYLQATWVLANIGRLLIIVEPCQQCLDEHRKTSVLICGLLTNDFEDNIKKSV